MFPKLGECVDDMCVIRSMWTDVPAHEPASRFMHTGSLQLPKPSLGSWVVYGLGTENQNMPGFISLGGKPEYRQAAFLPSLYQGVNVNYSPKHAADQVLLNIRNPFTPADDQRRAARPGPQAQRAAQREAPQGRAARGAHRVVRDGVPHADRGDRRVRHLQGAAGRPRAATAPARSAPSCSSPGGSSSAACGSCRCSPAGGTTTSNLEPNLRKKAGEIDQPAAALLKDLKQRGLLDDTLVIWGGEFGRTVTRDRNGSGQPGRDHNGRGFCTWLAGGGVKGGTRLRRDRRVRRPRRGEPRPRPRPARDDPRAARLRPHEAHLPLQRPRLPPDGQLRQRREGHHRVSVDSPRVSSSSSHRCLVESACDAASTRIASSPASSPRCADLSRRRRTAAVAAAAAADEGAVDVLRVEGPPDPRGQLLQVPQRRGEEGQGRPDARHAATAGTRAARTAPAIVPGDPAKSLLLKAVRYDDPDLQMPPERRQADRRADRGARAVGEDGRARPARRDRRRRRASSPG